MQYTDVLGSCNKSRLMTGNVHVLHAYNDYTLYWLFSYIFIHSLCNMAKGIKIRCTGNKERKTLSYLMYGNKIAITISVPTNISINKLDISIMPKLPNKLGINLRNSRVIFLVNYVKFHTKLYLGPFCFS